MRILTELNGDRDLSESFEDVIVIVSIHVCSKYFCSSTYIVGRDYPVSGLKNSSQEFKRAKVLGPNPKMYA